MFLPHVAFFRPALILELVVAVVVAAVVAAAVAALSLDATPPQAASDRPAKTAEAAATRARELV
jgi:hypothetical protein